MSTKRIIDTTKISNLAEQRASQVDVERQFGIPDLARLLRSAYYHGYRDAMLEHRFPVSESESEHG